MLEMPLVAVDEESRTRPPMPPRQKKMCRDHDCSRIGTVPAVWHAQILNLSQPVWYILYMSSLMCNLAYHQKDNSSRV